MAEVSFQYKNVQPTKLLGSIFNDSATVSPMEVNRTSFPALLPSILRAIARAHFVSFDLELSGITARIQRSACPLQLRYDEGKAAAEQYQILQVGLTCVEEDVVNGAYVLRSYHFNISPLIEERLELPRVVSFENGALAFLLGHGLSLDHWAKDGVPYLSVPEEKQARQIALAREDKSNIVDLIVAKDDASSLAFVKQTRENISAWQAKSNGKDMEKGTEKGTGMNVSASFVNIGPPGHAVDPHNSSSLDNYQKRLVHQLVRAEFPGLVSIGKSSFIQVTTHDQEREDGIKRSRQKRLDEQLARQIGFRWVIDALLGRDISGIDLKSMARNLSGSPAFVDPEALAREMSSLQTELKRKPTVLVGHNVFLDLLYLHQAFLGPLPDRVEDFQETIHQLFPLIVDTKYIATHDPASTHSGSSLAELDAQLDAEPFPAIITHPQHKGYEARTALHEAGYDSFLTAKIFLRLAHKLGHPALPRAVGSGRSQPLIPRFLDPVWNVYGNRLRMFGTDEKVCCLGGGAKAQPASGPKEKKKKVEKAEEETEEAEKKEEEKEGKEGGDGADDDESTDADGGVAIGSIYS
ncbi:MAG: hypothetical protein M1826_006742 [Phylliscum demangeonii]|nr:MAG: hypothetical protein M1826_006742 [Phylliscum demangeonii]